MTDYVNDKLAIVSDENSFLDATCYFVFIDSSRLTGNYLLLYFATSTISLETVDT
jgi:hypothetical protein